MTDYYSVQKIVEDVRAEAIKTAARERLASQAAVVKPKKGPAVRRVTARLRALALAGTRRPASAAQ
ncbi:MAG TPA: hypothetical protein VKT83_15230 [bacterium]|nr:hypothetical protein [bacterium]